MDSPTPHPRSEYYLQRKLDAPWRDLLRHARRRADRRGLTFTLTDDWAATAWTGRCTMTGLPFEITVSDTPGAKPFSPALDRIDKRRGWTPENCRFVLASVAALRAYYGDDTAAIEVARRLAAPRVVETQASALSLPHPAPSTSTSTPVASAAVTKG